MDKYIYLHALERKILTPTILAVGDIIPVEDMAGNESIERGFGIRPLRRNVIKDFRRILNTGETLPPIVVLGEPSGAYDDIFLRYLQGQSDLERENISITSIRQELQSLRKEYRK